MVEISSYVGYIHTSRYIYYPLQYPVCVSPPPKPKIKRQHRNQTVNFRHTHTHTHIQVVKATNVLRENYILYIASRCYIRNTLILVRHASPLLCFFRVPQPVLALRLRRAQLPVLYLHM